jgi:hypothetical protein
MPRNLHLISSLGDFCVGNSLCNIGYRMPPMHFGGKETWVPVSALPCTSYVTLGRIHNISKSHFPHVKCFVRWQLCLLLMSTLKVSTDENKMSWGREEREVDSYINGPNKSCFLVSRPLCHSLPCWLWAWLQPFGYQQIWHRVCRTPSYQNQGLWEFPGLSFIIKTWSLLIQSTISIMSAFNVGRKEAV